jgi:hypothetical protein
MSTEALADSGCKGYVAVRVPFGVAVLVLVRIK